MATTIPTSTIAPTFTAGGLASGLDTASIVAGFVKVEQLPLDQLKSNQSAVKSNISLLGGFVSALSSLDSATQALATNGLIAPSVQSSNSSFTAVAQTGAAVGSFDIQVQSLASAAKARSQSFAAVDSKVAGGTLHLSVNGKTTDVTVADGTGINDLAAQINGAAAGVSANVVFDGTNAYLNFTNQATGYTGTDPSAALGISFSPTVDSGGNPIASSYAALTTSKVQDATNAVFTLDKLQITRQSNVITDAVPGATLTLKSQGGPSEQLVLANDTNSVQSKLQTFVDAYNVVATSLNNTMNPTDTTQATGTLAADPGLRQLQFQMQSLISQTVSGTGAVRSLGDLGLKLDKDGTLSIDTAVMSAAVAKAPDGVNALFSTATTGVSALVSALVKTQTDPVSGLLIGEQQGMQTQVSSMDDEATRLQLHIDSYTANLQAQFAAMETIISSLKNTGDYLTQLSNAQLANKG